MEATRINETLADFSHTVLQHRREWPSTLD
jgi:hypothetical protein